MADTRTYEDFAGTLGRRVARVKEACGGAVGKKQYGGVQERPKSDEELKAAIIKADRLDRDRSEDGQRRLWAFLSGYPEIAVRYGTNPDQNLDWEPEAWSAALADHGVDTTGVSAWRRKYTPERADSLARAAYGVKDGTVQTKGKGGNIMNYTVYFKDGGLLPRSQRRVYQTGGKASAQDTMQQLYQLTQVAMNGSGQEQQQAMQALGQFVGEAMNGNQQYAQIIQAVFDGAKKGSREMTQMAQVFQSIMQQMQKREFGGRLDYITMLRNGGRPRYQSGGAGYGQKIKEYLDSAKSENDSKIVDALNNAKQATREQAQQFRNGFDADKMLSAQLDRILDSGDVDYNNHVPNGYIYDVDKWGNPYYIAPDGHEIYANRRIR